METTRGRRPLIVGLVHWMPKGINESPLARERNRVLSVLELFPRGSSIGVELTSSELAELRKDPDAHRVSKDVLLFAAKKAIELGHEVIPLDQSPVLQRHQRTSAVLHLAQKVNMLRLRILRDAPPKLDKKTLNHQLELDFQDYSPRSLAIVKSDEGITSYLRSLIMGKKMLRTNPDVVFVGDFHARDLHPILKETHRFSFTPESSGEAFRRYELAKPHALKSRLEAHGRKALAPFLMRWERENK